MATAKGGSLSKRTGNKLHRKSLYVQQKKDSEKERRESRFRRKREEAKDPEARRHRLEKNKPLTIDRKRQFDNANDDDDGLYSNVHLQELLKRRRLAEVDVPGSPAVAANEGAGADEAAEDDELDSMLGSDDENDGPHESSDDGDETPMDPRRIIREGSTAPSMATTIELAPESLVKKFPSLFSDDGPEEPKTLITTSLHSTIHNKAQELVSFIPNSDYVPRSQHKYSHNYSVREIAKYASNRGYSTLVILGEDQKKPSSLNVVVLPSGPTFTFSISNWMDVKKLPGHGNPQGRRACFRHRTDLRAYSSRLLPRNPLERLYHPAGRSHRQAVDVFVAEEARVPRETGKPLYLKLPRPGRDTDDNDDDRL